MDSPAQRLRWARSRARYGSASDAARAYGWKVSTYLGHENGDRNPSREAAKRYAKAFKVRWEWLLEGEGRPDLPELGPVPVRGYVGAGAAVAMVDDQGDFDEAPRPPGSGPYTAALRVRGDSMPGVAEDQWLIYYDERVSGVPDSYIGELCVVWLADGRVLVKRVYRGRFPGTYDLISTAYEPIRDELVEWSAKVSWIKPR
jgi:phage repressor protein C with HTH and peptisase S24 domain